MTSRHIRSLTRSKQGSSNSCVADIVGRKDRTMTVWLKGKNDRLDKVEHNVENVHMQGEYIHITYYKTVYETVRGVSYRKEDMDITRIEADR